MNKNVDVEYENIISGYYGKDAVSAIISLKVDTKEVDAIANKIASFDNIEDVFLVTGESDIITKVNFENYSKMKEFVVGDLASISGIKDSRTLMIVSAYKHKGKIQTFAKDE